MASETKITGESLPIWDIFKKVDALKIPRFQRSYAWGKSHVEEWWNAILNATKDDLDVFVGPLTLMERDGKQEVLDGQQRLTTTFLIYRWIYFYLNKQDLSFRDSPLYEDIVDVNVRVVRSGKPMLQLNKYDHDVFEKLLNKETLPAAKDQRPSHKKLIAANDFLKTKIKNLFEGYGKEEKNPKKILTILKALKEKIIVMRVNVGSEINAWELFESMNSAGADLAKSDLIKSHLFYQYTKQSEEIQQNLEDTWGDMEINLELSKWKFDDFFNYYWWSHHGTGQKPQVYRNIKSVCTGFAEARKEVDEFKNTSELIRDISGLSFDFVQDKKKTEKQNLLKTIVKNLLEMGTKQHYILTLVLLKYLNQWEIQNTIKYLKIIRNVTLKWLVCGVKGANTTKALIDEAKWLRKNNDEEEGCIEHAKTELDSLSGQLAATIYKDENEFKQNFSTWQPKARISIEILKECYPIGKGQGYVDKAVELEHICPKASEKWNDNIKKDHEKNGTVMNFESFKKKFQNEIGNHLLLTPTENKNAGNKTFKEKKKVYEKSDLDQAKKVAGCEKWTYKEMKAETKMTCKKIIENWELY